MNKKILSALLSALLLLSFSLSFSACEKEPAKQSDVEKYSYLTFETDEKSECATVVGYDMKTIPDEIAIPSEIDGYLVTAIGEYAFSDCKTVVSVTIPDSVETIGRSAFSGCFALENITLPKKLEVIPTEIFVNCRSLKKVNIPDNAITIEMWAFYSCEKLVHVKLPEKLVSIEQEAFVNCTNLSICLPKNVQLQGDIATRGLYDLFPISNTCGIIVDGTQNFDAQIRQFDRGTTLFVTFEIAPPSWQIYDKITGAWTDQWLGNCKVFYGCELKDNQNGERYVYSIPVKEFHPRGKDSFFICSVPSYNVNNGTASPYRDGYTFLGWSKTEGKNAPDYTFLSRKTVFDVQNGRVVVIGTAPGSDEEEVIPFGTTLYTVWEKSSD